MWPLSCALQEVIRALGIQHIEFKDESDPEIKQHTFTKVSHLQTAANDCSYCKNCSTSNMHIPSQHTAPTASLGQQYTCCTRHAQHTSDMMQLSCAGCW